LGQTSATLRVKRRSLAAEVIRALVAVAFLAEDRRNRHPSTGNYADLA
jgi:hypothetical protein